jgi:hypothetical protein
MVMGRGNGSDLFSYLVVNLVDTSYSGFKIPARHIPDSFRYDIACKRKGPRSRTRGHS